MDALDLIAKIQMDLSDYESGLDSAKSKAESSGSGISSAFGKMASGVGTAVSAATKVTAAAVTTAAAGIATLTTQAVSSYAEYEQLTGGIETLFGAGGKSVEEYADSVGKSVDEVQEEYDSLISAQETMFDNASEAYKTAGLSANEYMETAIGMSAAMVTALDGDTEAAADKVDMAITDMSDNVNKMGTSMESIQNAYSGFAKGNYTMLDNLALGYGGTAEEMERLITDAEALDSSFEAARDENGDLAMSYDDIVDAIHIVQTDMGITGTTALEASTTISGSLNTAKAAWSNLVTGLADDEADLTTLTQNLVDSLVGYTDEAGNEVNGFVDNIVPVVETALTSIGTLIEELVPSALELIPTLIDDVLPDLVSAATSLVEGLVNTFSDNIDSISGVVDQILDAFLDLIPEFLSLGGSIISTLASAILDNMDSILSAASEILEMFVTGLTSNVGSLVSGAVTIIQKLVSFITSNVSLLTNAAVTIITTLTTSLLNNLPSLISAGMDLLIAVVDGLLEALPTLIESLPQIVDAALAALTDGIPLILEGATTMFLAIVDALPEIVTALADSLPQIIDSVVSFLTGDGLPQILDAAITMFLAIVDAIPTIITTIAENLPTIISSITSALIDAAPELLAAAGTMFLAIIDALILAGASILSSIKEKADEWWAGVREKWQDFYDAGSYIMQGLKAGMESISLSAVGANATSAALSAINSTAEVSSPSKATMRTGRYMAEGLGIGWEEGMEEVDKEIEKGMNYEGNIDLSYSTDGDISTVTGSQSTLSQSDLDAIISGLQIHITNYTQLDGDVIDEHSYNYTVNRVGNETLATNIMQGGA